MDNPNQLARVNPANGMDKIDELLIYIGRNTSSQSALLYPCPATIVECDPKELIDRIAAALDVLPDTLGRMYNRLLDTGAML